MEESSDSSDDGDSGRRSINDSESDCDEERSYSSGEPASKPPKTDEEDEETLDQLSALPDSLILQILSLLPMEEVVKTSALSKKWQYLWTSVDNLIFINKDYSQSERFEKFINFLEKTLSLSSCSTIRKFAVQFDYDAFLRLDVTSPSLRTLKLKDFWYSCDDDDGALLEILAPNLRSLEISGYLYTMKCRLVNVSSLVDANLSFDLDTPADSSEIMKSIDEDEGEELEVSFDFSGDEKPRGSNGDEGNDYDGELSPPPPPPKLRKKRSQDRISAFSDSLSPTKRVFLSVPISNTSDEKLIHKFISFVDEALVLFTSSNIRKFCLDFPYERRFAPNVNMWVRFAMQKSVEELELNLYNQCPGNRYKLPQYVYANSSLTKLNLSKSKIMPYRGVSWKSLRALTIKCVVVSEIAIGMILSGGPVLEFLELYRSCVEHRLDINSSSLKKLVIRGYRNPFVEEDDSVLEISAPRFSSLEIVGVFHEEEDSDW
ncbi:hypothetical protein F0562_018416 [Nyssa sinensis]|uniref:F-box domain-containing protein n=1 Tax=Nyssa sinensis TaxID=561372 RepID=A0A5J4ZC76_9ASTE|nr:hypothetical protein F0562_018416 [Nyssa sinensis]